MMMMYLLTHDIIKATGRNSKQIYIEKKKNIGFIQQYIIVRHVVYLKHSCIGNIISWRCESQTLKVM